MTDELKKLREQRDEACALSRGAIAESGRLRAELADAQRQRDEYHKELVRLRDLVDRLKAVARAAFALAAAAAGFEGGV